MGICNGFQVLAEAGLLPGALLQNDNQKYVCKNTHLKVGTPNTALTRELDPSKPYRIPIAHGEGRFYASKEELQKISANDQVLFRYCDASGSITESANPNGSIDNIAGVCNEKRNVFGMMPHPERAADSILGNEDGKDMLASLLSLAGVA